uniref:EamA domain-containing protein n=1 Tax=Eucampia antarctica TaxID=49252 RepID=A0A7S2VZR1_9STRA|mmetsp:Transcript_14743/g.14217  ORF Transcript_14743/g.14217 Transcript_14743/m.14217 type:complete len:380 (+) Transcript_14743:183-1322(+)
MLLDTCGVGCGWIAAVVGCVGLGTFGVPMKSNAANRVDVDPFVMQTYKSSMCFITSWLVLLIGASFEFSPWGLLSGLLWVTGGTAGIFGIRNAGLAVSVGTWSGICVLVSFFWGLFIFDERVKSLFLTCIGMGFLIGGLIGMTFFSCPERKIESMIILEQDVETVNLGESLLTKDSDQDDPQPQHEADGQQFGHHDYYPTTSEAFPKKDNHIIFLGVKFERYTLGLIGAASDGLLGGSALVPMHYSKAGGIEYVISFGIGAAVITILGWILRLGYNCRKTGSLNGGWNSLPSMHFKTLWMHGCTAGILWSIGNIGNILSVTYLGEGIGMSVVQCAMMVSGLFGILYFKEIQGTTRIIGWALSGLLTIASIAFLGQEHEK